jgi:butyrate response factor 1
MSSTDDESCSSENYNEPNTNLVIPEKNFDINQEPYYPKTIKYPQLNKNNNANNINEQNIKSKEQKLKFRTELCKLFEINGFCKFGKNCNFAHGKENIRENLFKKSGYKKRACKNFFQKGFCMYGNRCQFSHKIQNIKNINNFSYISELKNINENNLNNYKREKLPIFKQIIENELI